MPNLRNALLAGIAALGIGFSGAASAQTTNLMTVPVPGGGLAEIRYVGDVPPRVVFLPAPATVSAWAPVSSFFGGESPFAMIDRISAEMDRRTAAMFRYAEAMANQAPGSPLIEARFGNLPPGSQSFTYVSTMSGNGVCTQSMRITSTGNGPPHVERHSSGNCGPAAAPSGPAVTRPVLPAPAPATPANQPDLILTQNTGANPYAGMVRQVAARTR